MKIGYARISTRAQNLDMQFAVLEAYGVEKRNIFTDIVSGAKEKREGLEKLLMVMRKGDLVVVYNLSRLGRNLKHLLTLMEVFKETGIEFKSVMEPFLDTETPEGNLIFNIFGALNQFQRERNREVVMKGIETARAQGRTGGRPKGMSQRLKDMAPGVASMWKMGKTISEIRNVFPIAQASVYKCLDHEKIHYDNYAEVVNRMRKKKRTQKQQKK